MTTRAKQKGSAFERDVAGILADELGTPVKRVLLSGIQGEGDIQGIPDIHVECKRCEAVRLNSWFDSKTKGVDKPFVLIHKRSRERIFVTMELQDWIKLFREALI